MTIQSFYMGERGLVLANAVVRVALALQYMALFALPFVLAAGGSLVRGQSRVRRAMAVASVAICLSIVALWQHLRGGSPWMPYLPWNFDAVTRWPAAARAAITVLASIGAVALARIFWLRWFGAGGWRAMSPAARFVDLASLFVMSLHMVLYQLGDEYLLVLLPLTLMALARHIPTQRTWSVRLAAAGCIVVWGLSAEWTRASLAAGEAQWQAAEGLCQAGIPRKQVCGPWTWVAYDRFDDYLQRINRRPVRDLKSFWVQWLPDQLARARFCVTAAPEGPPEGIWIVRRRIPYAGPWFGEAFVYVFERRGNAAAD
jgi:hypothetical protein